jgi:dCTP deaminase
VILSDRTIREELAAGRIVIDPFTDDMIGPASIDLHLGDELRVFDEDRTPIDVNDDVDFRVHTTVTRLDAPFALSPGQTVLGITRERITLAADLCGWLEGRSRFARVGLMIHVTAGFVSPGIDNKQVLEISNVSDRVLYVHPRTRLCQIVIQRTDGSAVYSGRFAKQYEV